MFIQAFEKEYKFIYSDQYLLSLKSTLLPVGVTIHKTKKVNNNSIIG